MTAHELQVTPVAVVIAFMVWESGKVLLLSLPFSKRLTQQAFRIISFTSWAEFGYAQILLSICLKGCTPKAHGWGPVCSRSAEEHHSFLLLHLVSLHRGPRTGCENTELYFHASWVLLCLHS